MTTNEMIECFKILLENHVGGCPILFGNIHDCSQQVNATVHGANDYLSLYIKTSVSEWHELQYRGDKETEDKIRKLVGEDSEWDLGANSIDTIYHFNLIAYLNMEKYLAEEDRIPVCDVFRKSKKDANKPKE